MDRKVFTWSAVDVVDGVVDWRLLVELCEAEVENPSVDSIEAIEDTINKRKADARMNPIIICLCSPLSS